MRLTITLSTFLFISALNNALAQSQGQFIKVASWKQATRTVPALLAAPLSVVGSTMPVEPFSDSFEGTNIYPYWSINQQSGTVLQSKDQAYSGSQSLKLKSTPGSQVVLTATHKFPKPTKGTVSIRYFDTAPGQETLYQFLVLSDSRNPQNTSGLGVNDYDSQCYIASVTAGTQGPNASCGYYPQMTTSPVKRSYGWHVFSVTYDQTTVSLAIDGTVIFTGQGNYYFDTVQLTCAGPSWRPAGIAYYDGFEFTPLPLYAN